MFSHHLGAATQADPSTYKCTTAGCYDYQSPDMHQQILALQNGINRFSQNPDIGFEPIAVDGIIGKGTTQALLWALTSIANIDAPALTDTALAASSFIDAIQGPIDVVRFIYDLNPIVKTGADYLNMPTVPPPMVASAPRKSAVPTTAKAAALQTKFMMQKPALAAGLFGALPPWAGYAAGVLIIGGVLFYVFTKKPGVAKSAPATVSGHRRRRRFRLFA